MIPFSALFTLLTILTGPIDVEPVRPAPATYTTPVATAEVLQP